MSKLHAISHTAELGLKYGCMSQMSCHGRETTHKKNVTQVYWTTSTREETRDEEMTNALREIILRDADEYFEDMLESAEITATREKSTDVDGLVYSTDFYSRRESEMPRRRLNEASFTRLKGTSAKNLMIFGDSILNDDYKQLMHPMATSGYLDRLQRVVVANILSASSVATVCAVKSKGGLLSEYDEICVYCDSNYRNTGPTYSFISFKEGSDIYCGRVVAITQLQVEDMAPFYLLDVALLTPVLGAKEAFFPWDKLTWKVNNESEIIMKTIRDLQIHDSLYLVPDMDTNASADSFNSDDVYYYKPRSFFERNGVKPHPQLCPALDEVGKTPESSRKWIEENLATGQLSSTETVPKLDVSLNPSDYTMVNPL